MDPESGEVVFVGSETETALLQFAKELEWRDFKETRDAPIIVQVISFSSGRMGMGVVIKLPEGGYRAYFKGACEVLATKSTSHIVIHQDGQYPDSIVAQRIDELAQTNIGRTIVFHANQTLRTTTIYYRDFPSWPGMRFDDQGDVRFFLFVPIFFS